MLNAKIKENKTIAKIKSDFGDDGLFSTIKYINDYDFILSQY